MSSPMVMVELDPADDIVVLFVDLEVAQGIPDRLDAVVSAVGMQSVRSMCKPLIQDDLPLPTALRLQSEDTEVVDRYTYLCICMSNSGVSPECGSARVAKARVALVNSHHLGRQ